MALSLRLCLRQSRHSIVVLCSGVVMMKYSVVEGVDKIPECL